VMDVTPPLHIRIQHKLLILLRQSFAQQRLFCVTIRVIHCRRVASFRQQLPAHLTTRTRRVICRIRPKPAP